MKEVWYDEPEIAQLREQPLQLHTGQNENPDLSFTRWVRWSLKTYSEIKPSNKYSIVNVKKKKKHFLRNQTMYRTYNG